jgi:uncharacterized membrane protein
MQVFKTKQLVKSGLMAALVMIGTMIVQIPTPTKGYIHAGDSMVYLCGFLLGPLAGSLAAAVGSALADLYSGYTSYAPATFIIKGMDALVVAYCCRLFMIGNGASITRKVIGFVFGILLGGTIMVLGYLAYETYLTGFATALTGVPANITQAVGGGVIAVPLMLALEKAFSRKYSFR